MRIPRLWTAIGVGALFGFAISYLDWILGTAGSGIRIPQGDSMIATEYWIGLPCVVLLGYLFPRYPIECAVVFMWAPVSLRHLVYISEHGVPNLWPVEISIIAALTLPYIGLAYGGAYLRRKTDAASVT